MARKMSIHYAAENVEEKMAIAEKAKKFLDDGRSIFLDAGSTMMYFSRLILTITILF